MDAPLIADPPSTKNRDGKRDAEMHQSNKAKNWLFGMKAHIGVDTVTGLTHTLVDTAGNVSEVTPPHALLHGQESIASGDAGYRGVNKEHAGKAIMWYVATKPSKRRA